ncbi:MAG: NAD(P)H-dependent oxidoreductase [Thermoguttaceae bacterium]|nr:NAD(P)H-dependent oxidoreductase [Thermoguttaceae bacterium]
MSKNLIIYYSRKGTNYVSGSIRNLPKGNTEVCAELIQKTVGGDLFEVETVKPYSEDYNTCTEEAKAEKAADARPELKAYLDDIAAYDNIFVCGPCWWSTYPYPVFSLLEKLDFTGKRVYGLMTHEGSGLGASQRDLARFCPGAAIGKGIAVFGSEVLRTPDSAETKIRDWLAGLEL